MFRAVSRAAARRPAAFAVNHARSRFISTAPPHLQSRSWRSSALRWGVAIAGVYYYNTSTLFAEEPSATLSEALDEAENRLPTLESYSPSSRKKQQQQELASVQVAEHEEGQPQTAEELEEDAHSQGAFNEETGEINWDCPCLGGMAYGPCGEEFREAFSCFVFSEEDPKGMDCIDKFKGMQDCFRLHPETYQAELEDDDEEELEGAAVPEGEGVHVAAAQPEDAPSVAAAVKDAVQDKDFAARDAATEEPADAQVKPAPPATTAAQVQTPAADEPSKDAAPPAETKAADTHPDRSSEITDAMAEIEGDMVPRAAHDARDTSSKKN